MCAMRRVASNCDMHAPPLCVFRYAAQRSGTHQSDAWQSYKLSYKLKQLAQQDQRGLNQQAGPQRREIHAADGRNDPPQRPQDGLAQRYEQCLRR